MKSVPWPRANPYRLLGLAQNASAEEVRRAYRRAAMECHPDRNIADRAAATAKFQQVQMAYEALHCPTRRRMLNDGLGMNRSYEDFLRSQQPGHGGMPAGFGTASSSYYARSRSSTSASANGPYASDSPFEPFRNYYWDGGDRAAFQNWQKRQHAEWQQRHGRTARGPSPGGYNVGVEGKWWQDPFNYDGTGSRNANNDKASAEAMSRSRWRTWIGLAFAFIAVESLVYASWKVRVAHQRAMLEEAARDRRLRGKEKVAVASDTSFLADDMEELDHHRPASDMEMSVKSLYTPFSESQRDNDNMPAFTTTNLADMKERLRRRNVDKLRKELGTTPEEDGDSLETLVRMKHERRYQIRGKPAPVETVPGERSLVQGNSEQASSKFLEDD